MDSSALATPIVVAGRRWPAIVVASATVVALALAVVAVVVATVTATRRAAKVSCSASVR